MRFRDILVRIGRQPGWLIVTECLLLTMLLGVLDYITGDFSLMMFYLIPIYFAVWLTDRTWGLTISLLCGTELFAVSVLQFPYGVQILSVRSWNSLMEVFFLLFSGRLLFTLKNELELHRELSLTDSLTGIRNRRSFYELADYELNKTRRYGRALTMVFIDLDNFKEVNDCFGHDRGDRLLRAVATTIREHFRSSDIVARIGGDEFAVLLPETGAEAMDMLLKLQFCLNKTMAQYEGSVTTSIGAVTFESPPISVDKMVSYADKLMYKVKHDGKNRVSHVTMNESS